VTAYFYSLGTVLSDYYARAGSGLREAELRAAVQLCLALEDEENQ
jgi:hypothetical protein